MHILLLGAGMQGKAALHDLVANPAVTTITAADADLPALHAHVAAQGWQERVACHAVDATDTRSLARLFARQPDVAIALLPSSFNAAVARLAVDHGVNLVNTSYAPPELAALDGEARAKGITILPEFGLDPGIDLVMLGEAARALDTVDEIHSYGSGIPEWSAADNPLRYKISWTFEGVLAAYRRPARAVRAGAVVDIPPQAIFAPQNMHPVTVDGLGELEAYPNGDAAKYAAALGVDLATLRASGRYTMRWPGHCAFWRTIVDLGLLDEAPVLVDGMPVDRLRYLAAALAPRLQYAPGERDVVVVRVDVSGMKEGRRRRIRYELVDFRDLDTGFSGMNRTVGFTAAIGAVMIGDRRIHGPGVLSPIHHVPYASFEQELRARGVILRRETADLP